MYIVEAPDGDGTRAGDYHLTGDANRLLEHRHRLFEAVTLGQVEVPALYREPLLRMLATGAPVIPALFTPGFDAAAIAVYNHYWTLKGTLFDAEQRDDCIEPETDNVQALSKRLGTGVEGAPEGGITRLNRYGHKMMITPQGFLPLIDDNVEALLLEGTPEMAALHEMRARGVAINAVAACVEVSWLGGRPEIGNDYYAFGTAYPDGSFTPTGTHHLGENG